MIKIVWMRKFTPIVSKAINRCIGDSLFCAGQFRKYLHSTRFEWQWHSAAIVIRHNSLDSPICSNWAELFSLAGICRAHIQSQSEAMNCYQADNWITFQSWSFLIGNCIGFISDQDVPPPHTHTYTCLYGNRKMRSMPYWYWMRTCNSIRNYCIFD